MQGPQISAAGGWNFSEQHLNEYCRPFIYTKYFQWAKSPAEALQLAQDLQNIQSQPPKLLGTATEDPTSQLVGFLFDYSGTYGEDLCFIPAWSLPN